MLVVFNHVTDDVTAVWGLLLYRHLVMTALLVFVIFNHMTDDVTAVWGLLLYRHRVMMALLVYGCI